jgi:hypothetical protein
MKIYELAKYNMDTSNKESDDYDIEWVRSFVTFDGAKMAAAEDQNPGAGPDTVPVFIHLDDYVPEFWQWMSYEIQEIEVEGTHEVYVVTKQDDFIEEFTLLGVATTLEVAKDILVDEGCIREELAPDTDEPADSPQHWSIVSDRGFTIYRVERRGLHSA